LLSSFPLGTWLALAASRPTAGTPDLRRRRRVVVLFFAVGVIGGIYAIGGGSILRPILVGLGFSVLEVAPAAPS